MSDLKQELSKSPRVEACIDAVMARFHGESKAALARYYEEVHQHLAPLARDLEIELAEAKAELSRRTQPEATAPVQDLSAAILAMEHDCIGGVGASNYIAGFNYAKQLAADLASSANALSAGDRVDAEMTFLEEWLTLAATPVGLECCGQSSGECCGNGIAVERGAEEVISAMAARHRELSAILQSQKAK